MNFHEFLWSPCGKSVNHDLNKQTQAALAVDHPIIDNKWLKQGERCGYVMLFLVWHSSYIHNFHLKNKHHFQWRRSVWPMTAHDLLHRKSHSNLGRFSAEHTAVAWWNPMLKWEILKLNDSMTVVHLIFMVVGDFSMVYSSPSWRYDGMILKNYGCFTSRFCR